MQAQINVTEPWKDLDIDDSDLTSLLRPCKRRHSTGTAHATTPSLLATEENHLQLRVQTPPLTSSRQKTIPGPAGTVQAAMHRKNLDRENNQNAASYRENDKDLGSDDPNNGMACTQDYIQRAMETPDFDDDFARHPWLSALQFIDAKDGVVQSTPISSLKNCLNAGKAARVVAVIKSSTPSNLGGLGVVLKDPTGTICASIHHKVLSQTEFGKKLTAGAVLILREVAFFSPVRSAQCLNITQRNLVKVFCQDDESIAELNNSSHPIHYVDSAIEYFGNENIMGKMPTTRGRNLSVGWRQNCFTEIVQHDSRSSNTDGERPAGLIQDTYYDVPNDPTRTNSEARCVWQTSDEEVQGTNGDRMQEQHSKVKASMPCWTDEQLNELFAGGDDDLLTQEGMAEWM